MAHTYTSFLAHPFRCLGAALMAGLLSLSGTAHAAHEAANEAANEAADDKAAAGEFKPQLWLDSGFWSHHTKPNANASKPYREHNAGLGVEWRFKPQWQVNAGHYRNSLDEASNYLQLGWMPLNWSPAGDLKLEFGGSVGVVNGYPGIANKGYFPSLVPVATAEWRRVGINLVYIPSIGRIHGAYAAQLKFLMF